jgi:hypothetical protein
MMMMDIKNYYIGTPLPRFEYMKMLRSRFPEEIIHVNPSGKASAQIPQLPLGDNSSPWGDNATCTGAHTGYTAGSAKSLSATYQYKISNTRNKLLANKNLTNN